VLSDAITQIREQNDSEQIRSDLDQFKQVLDFFEDIKAYFPTLTWGEFFTYMKKIDKMTFPDISANRGLMIEDGS
jgi:hypothetical protein